MEQQEQAIPKPITIGKLSSAVHPSFAFLAGCQLDVFSPLGKGPQTSAQIAEELGVSEEKLRPLLYALVSSELMTIDGDMFSNTDESNFYLVKGRPAYIGGMHELISTMWEAELLTAGSIRAGKPLAKHDYSESTEEELKKVFRGLHPRAIGDARALANQHDFTKHHTLLDVGGGSGGMAIGVLGIHTHMTATVIDLPTVIPITTDFVGESDVSDRIQVKTVDILNEEIGGTYDVATLRAFIQVLGVEQSKHALKEVSKALKPGGEIFILGSVLDDSRISPAATVAFNLLFLNVYDEGQAYTEQEYRTWLGEAGFENITRKVLADGSSIIHGLKTHD